MAWYDGLISGASDAWQNDPWGTIGNVGAFALPAVSTFSGLMGGMRAADEARQRERVNREIMEANRRNADIYGREQAGREEANRINLLRYQSDQAMRDQANARNLEQWQRDQALREQANALNLSGYQERLQQARGEEARRTSGLDQLRALSSTPINTSEFYKPMSDAESMSRRRAIQADMASRGRPIDSAYATNLMSEQMAGTESERFLQALQAALQARGRQQSMLAGSIPGVPEWGNFTPATGGRFEPQFSGGAPQPAHGQGAPFTQPTWGGAPQGVDLSSPFSWLIQQNQQRRQPTRQGDTGNATTGGLSFSANEMAQQSGAPGWKDYGGGAGWGLPLDNSV